MNVLLARTARILAQSLMMSLCCLGHSSVLFPVKYRWRGFHVPISCHSSDPACLFAMGGTHSCRLTRLDDSFRHALWCSSGAGSSLSAAVALGAVWKEAQNWTANRQPLSGGGGGEGEVHVQYLIGQVLLCDIDWK